MTNSRLQLGPFLLEKQLNRGGTSEVWRATYDPEGVPVAVKLLDVPDAHNSRSTLASFQQEVLALASLDHPYIVSVIDYGQVSAKEAATSDGQLEAGRPYLVMEYAHGGTLQTLPHDLSWPQIRAILLKILEALAHAHAREVIHRDLKPGNILLRSGTGSVEDIMLSDFGLAYLFESQTTHHQDRIIGTPAYMAPEQIQNDWRNQGPWTDLYALGCMAWCLLHGQPPFGIRGEHLFEAHLSAPLPQYKYNPKVSAPDELRGWLKTLLAKHPRERFRFAADAARALLRVDSLSSNTTVLLKGWTERQKQRETTIKTRTGLGLVELRPIPFVGRQQELEQLKQLFNQTRETSQTMAVFLKGKAGVGKSRLAQKLVQDSDELGLATVLHATNTPYLAPQESMARMLRHFLKSKNLGTAQTLERVRNVLRRTARREDTQEVLEQDAHTLMQLLFPAQMPQSKETVQYDVMNRLLLRASAHRPLIIWIDDVQWATNYLRFLNQCINHPQAQCARVFFIFTLEDDTEPDNLRDTLIDQLVNHERVRLLKLTGLNPLTQTALIRNMLPLDPKLAREVERRTDGNPLFAIQLISDWIRRKALTSTPNGWALEPEVDDSLPEDIDQVFKNKITRLLEQLPEHHANARDAFEIAAALGVHILPDEWRAACDEAGIQIPPLLIEIALECGLTQWTDVGWSFEHPMMRESLLKRSQHQGRATRHHMACAHMLKKHYGDTHPHIAERLANHLIHGNQPIEALAPLLIALKHKSLQGDLDQAHALFKKWEQLTQQLGISPTDERWLKGRLMHIEVELRQGIVEHVEEALDQILEVTLNCESQEYFAHAMILKGWLKRKFGELEQARAYLERARRVLETHNINEYLGRCLVNLGELYVTMGERALAQTTMAKSLNTLSPDQHTDLGRALMILSELAHQRGDDIQGEAYLKRAIAQFQREDNRVSLAQAYNFQGEIARIQGHYEQASTHYKRALAFMSTTASHDTIIPCLNLFFVVIAQKKYHQANKMIPGLLHQVERDGWAPYKSIVLLGRLCCEGAQRQWDRWTATFPEILDVVTQHNQLEADLAVLAMHTGELAEQQEQWDFAIQAYHLAQDQWQSLKQKEHCEDIQLRLNRIKENK